MTFSGQASIAYESMMILTQHNGGIHAYLQQCIDSRKISGCEQGNRVISYGKLDNGTGRELVSKLTLPGLSGNQN